MVAYRVDLNINHEAHEAHEVLPIKIILVLTSF